MPATVATYDHAEALQQSVRIPHRTDSLLGVDSLPVPADVPQPVKASAEAPKATTQRTYPEPRKMAATGLHAAIVAHRPALAGVAQAMTQRPRTRDDKTPEHVQQAQYLQAQEQEIVDAVIGQLLVKGFRVYPDGLHCESCQTPLDEQAAEQAAFEAWTRKRTLATIFKTAADTAKVNAHKYADAVTKAMNAYEVEDWDALQDAMQVLRAVRFPVEEK